MTELQSGRDDATHAIIESFQAEEGGNGWLLGAAIREELNYDMQKYTMAIEVNIKWTFVKNGSAWRAWQMANDKKSSARSVRQG